MTKQTMVDRGVVKVKIDLAPGEDDSMGEKSKVYELQRTALVEFIMRNGGGPRTAQPTVVADLHPTKDTSARSHHIEEPFALNTNQIVTFSADKKKSKKKPTISDQILKKCSLEMNKLQKNSKVLVIEGLKHMHAARLIEFWEKQQDTIMEHQFLKQIAVVSQKQADIYKSILKYVREYRSKYSTSVPLYTYLYTVEDNVLQLYLTYGSG
jgi:hypothetical protein